MIKKMSLLKRFFISAVMLAVIIIIAVFIYRHQLIQYSADTIIRKALPDYITIDRIHFDSDLGRLTLGGFKILNAPGFSSKYAIEIENIECRFRLKGKIFLDGIEILEPSFVKPLIHIERLQDSRVNLVEMGKFIESQAGKAPQPAEAQPKKESPPAKQASKAKSAPGKPISEVLKLPETFNVKSGIIVFTDRLVSPSKPHVLTFDNVNSKLSLRLDPSYKTVLDVGSTGQGLVNNDRSQVIKWNISLKPTAPRLTMSSRFDVSGVDVLLFTPYYDRFSPFTFHKGYMSGTLVFDFDNGSIGSTNEVHLRDIAISVKPGSENALFWETNVQDLAKYFTQFGEIVFDFKIKGELSNPRFYLGPISKQALTAMAIDKVSAVIQEAASAASAGNPESDRTKQYIDLFQSLIKKK